MAIIMAGTAPIATFFIVAASPVNHESWPVYRREPHTGQVLNAASESAGRRLLPRHVRMGHQNHGVSTNAAQAAAAVSKPSA